MNIQIEKKGKWIIFYLKRRLDVPMSLELETQAGKEVEGGETHILFNLEELEYISSSGLRVFIAIMRKLMEKKGSLRMCCLPPPVRKILRVVNLESMFDIYEKQEDALA